jgi:hypothetical protein
MAGNVRVVLCMLLVWSIDARVAGHTAKGVRAKHEDVFSARMQKVDQDIEKVCTSALLQFAV